jgi:hypothetical protein
MIVTFLESLGSLELACQHDSPQRGIVNCVLGKSGYLLPEKLSGAQCCEQCRKCNLSIRPADALWFTDYHSSVWQSFSF